MLDAIASSSGCSGAASRTPRSTSQRSSTPAAMRSRCAIASRAASRPCSASPTSREPRKSPCAPAVVGEVRQPDFLHPQQTFIAPLTQLRDDDPGFTVARLRFAPRVERKLTPQLTVSAGYNIEYDDLSDVPSSTIARFEGG